MGTLFRVSGVLNPNRNQTCEAHCAVQGLKLVVGECQWGRLSCTFSPNSLCLGEKPEPMTRLGKTFSSNKHEPQHSLGISKSAIGFHPGAPDSPFTYNTHLDASAVLKIREGKFRKQFNILGFVLSCCNHYKQL